MFGTGMFGTGMFSARTFGRGMFSTALRKKRAVGLVLLVVLLSLFLWFNRIPKLDTVQADLVDATAPAAACFQGFCVDNAPARPCSPGGGTSPWPTWNWSAWAWCSPS